MKNQPNMYRVNYQVMEGNNYAGGWGGRTADVESLGDVERFRNVKSVQPIYIELGDAMRIDIVEEAIAARKEMIDRNRKLGEVSRAKAELQRAESQI